MYAGGHLKNFVIRLRQSCVLLSEVCIVVLQVVLCNLKLVETLSKFTKAAKITLPYGINYSVLKGFPALKAKFHIHIAQNCMTQPGYLRVQGR